MTGWRIGWMVLPEDLVRRTEMLQQNLFISAPTLSQIAARRGAGRAATMRTRRRRTMPRTARSSRRAGRAGLRVGGEPDGAFYAYADVGRFTNDSHELLQADAAGGRGGGDARRRLRPHRRRPLRAVLLCRDRGRRWRKRSSGWSASSEGVASRGARRREQAEAVAVGVLGGEGEAEIHLRGLLDDVEAERSSRSRGAGATSASPVTAKQISAPPVPVAAGCTSRRAHKPNFSPLGRTYMAKLGRRAHRLRAEQLRCRGRRTSRRRRRRG